MKIKGSVWKLFFLSLFVFALLSCMGFGGEKEYASESPPLREEVSKASGAEKRESAAEETQARRTCVAFMETGCRG